MAIAAGEIAWALIWPPAWAGTVWLLSRGMHVSRCWASWVLAAAGAAATEAIARQPAACAIAAASAVFGAIMWWLSRRRRDRIRKAYGAKSRARLAALARSMRDSAKPRPVLKPQPQGA